MSKTHINTFGASVYGAALSNMKNAANAFLDVVNALRKVYNFVPSIGITGFSSAPNTISSITILNDNNIAQLKNAISTISAGGSTAMYDACLHSLNKLKSVSNRSRRVCMLFTDGEENASHEKFGSSVVSSFNEHNIPIYAFGYGSASYHSNCRVLSSGTKGQFHANLVGSSAVTSAWRNVFADVANLQDIKTARTAPSSGLEFTIDPTVNSSTVEFTYTLQNTNSYATFTIVDNNGMQVASTTTTIPLGTSYPQEQIAIISIDSTAVAGASVGTWTCNVSSSGLVSTEIEGVVRMEGKSDGTYAVAIEDVQEGFYDWPQPLHLSASTTGKQGYITGLNVTAALKSPSGSVTSVSLNDGGVDGDRIANDGIYALDYSDYTENGQYTLSVRFDNHSGGAYYAIDGVCYSNFPDSSVSVSIDTVFVTDDFTRVKDVVLHIAGVDARPPTRTGSIMGFESDTLWTIINSSGTLSSSTVRTEGKASLQIAGNGWQQIKSSDINTDELYGVTNKLAVDLYMGDTQNNPYWTGQVQLFVNCPSANVYNQFIDFADLTGLPLDTFSTLSFTLPPNILGILNGSYSDVSFSLSINTNAFTGVYYFDNMRFEN